MGQILPDVSDVRVVIDPGVYPQPRVEFQTPYGWVSYHQLSHGYQTVTAWVIDLASRMAEHYSNIENPLEEPAIVLVDEIELHLHPRWQRQLIDVLTNIFPNTQFIVTAHNPLIVQAAAGQDANIVLLKRVGDHVEVINDLDHIRNWRIDQIYTSDLFDLPSARPPWQDRLLERRTQILSQGHLSESDLKELSEIEQQLGTIVTGESVKVLRSEVKQFIDETRPQKAKPSKPKRANGKATPRKTKKP